MPRSHKINEPINQIAKVDKFLVMQTEKKTVRVLE